MKLAIVTAIAILLELVFWSPALCQPTPFDFYASASGTLSGGTGLLFKHDSDFKNSAFGGLPRNIILQGGYIDPLEGGIQSASANMVSQSFAKDLRIVGQVEANGETGFVQANAQAIAGMHDKMTFQLPSGQSGVPMIADASWNLTGSMLAIENDAGGARSVVQVFGTGLTFAPVGRDSAPDDPALPDIPQPNSIPVRLNVTSGIPTNVQCEINVNLLAGVAPFFDITTQTWHGGSAIAHGVFKKSLSWGGITRVTNAVTGEVITGWTVTSASGTDYSTPFQIPEPSTLLLLVGIGTGWAMAIRRNTQQ